jgi:spore germination protein
MENIMAGRIFNRLIWGEETMGKKFIIIFCFLCFFVSFPTIAEDFSVYIDGEKIESRESPYLIDGRALVPVRLIMEGIKADVNWLPEDKKAIIKNGPHEIILSVGQDYGLVNGVKYPMDVSISIIESRIYIPLRFLGESLGAKVDWDPAARSVLIETKGKRPDVILGYYTDYNSYISMQNNLEIISGILPLSYQINNKGNIVTNVDFPIGRELAKQHNKQVMGVVFSNDANLLSEVLNDPQKVDTLVADIVNLALKEGFQGINIDFESIKSEDRESFENFISKLYKLFAQKDLLLFVCVPAKTGIEYWNDAYNYKNLATVADKLIIMAYDEHYPGSKPGPVASLGWVENVVNYAVNQVEKDKLILGIGIYGYEWPQEGLARTLDVYTANIQAEENNIIPAFHQEKYVPYYEYLDGNQKKQVWYENPKSILGKIELVYKYSLNGIALWRLGIIPKEIWNVIQ